MRENCVRVLVHRERLRANLRMLRARHPGLMPVLKADAYGHGRKMAVRVLVEERVDWVALGTVGEGALVRNALGGRANVGGPRIVALLGLLGVEDRALALARDIVPLIHDRAGLELARNHGGPSPLPVAIKVDTGMGRLGFTPQETAELAARLIDSPQLYPVLAISHFAGADDPDLDAVTLRQARDFVSAVQALRARFPSLLASMCNSPALLTLPGTGVDGTALDPGPQGLAETLAGYSDLARPGLALYGINPLEGTPRERMGEGLLPVMEVSAPILAVHELAEGASASYGCTFTAPRAMRVAVVGVGYADGYPRALSGRGVMWVKGRRARILGRICMQMCLLDVSELPDVRPGDEAWLLGGPAVKGQDPVVQAGELATLAGTIPYELCCSLGRNPCRIEA